MRLLTEWQHHCVVGLTIGDADTGERLEPIRRLAALRKRLQTPARRGGDGARHRAHGRGRQQPVLRIVNVDFFESDFVWRDRGVLKLPVKELGHARCLVVLDRGEKRRVAVEHGGKLTRLGLEFAAHVVHHQPQLLERSLALLPVGELAMDTAGLDSQQHADCPHYQEGNEQTGTHGKPVQQGAILRALTAKTVSRRNNALLPCGDKFMVYCAIPMPRQKPFGDRSLCRTMGPTAVLTANVRR